jgi:hypothetical protein
VTDAEIVDMSRPRLFWSDTETDLKKLRRASQSDAAAIAGSEPSYLQDIIGEGRFGVIEV